jgi:serine/threonine protein kinase
MGRQIKVKEFLITADARFPKGITAVEIGDQAVAGGGFGFIYECISINGKQPSPAQFIKLLKGNKEGAIPAGYPAVVKLQQRIKAPVHNDPEYAKNTPARLPALKAFPGFSFKGELEGKEVYGYSTANLRRLGFYSLDDTLNGTGIERENFKNLSFNKRFQCCFHLASGFNLLSGLNYVHADINPKNIFINTDSGELAIIDYDGGGILDQPQDDTLTHGKLEDGEWLAPEIYEKLEANQDLKVDRHCDQWSVCVAFHYLLFGYDPFFFIREQSKKCKEDYLNASKFYPINLSDPNVSENTLFAIDSYMNTIRTDIPAAIHETLVRNYSGGFFNPRQRTPYSAWMELFKQTQSPPVIEYFNSSKGFALKGTQVKLSWKVRDAIELSIDNQVGDVTGKNEVTVRSDQHRTYSLTASGHFGEAKESAEINVFPVPVIEYLKIPVPDFGAPVYFPKMEIEAPVVKLTIHLEKDKLTKTPGTFISLPEELVNMQPLYKREPTLWSISHVFNKIKQAIISK